MYVSDELYDSSACFGDLYNEVSRRYLIRQTSDKAYLWAACSFNWRPAGDVDVRWPRWIDVAGPYAPLGLVQLYFIVLM